MKFLSKLLYYGTLVCPIYNFLKDLIQGGYVTYINHQQEIETAKMYAKMRKDELQNISPDEFWKEFNEIVTKKRSKK